MLLSEAASEEKRDVEKAMLRIFFKGRHIPAGVLLFVRQSWAEAQGSLLKQTWRVRLGLVHPDLHTLASAFILWAFKVPQGRGPPPAVL